MSRPKKPNTPSRIQKWCLKMDKQALAKHHFWILLGVFGFFGLLLIILVPVLIGSEIKDKEAAYNKEAADLEAASRGPTTQGYVDALQGQTEQLGQRRSTIWRDMYTPQAG